MLGGVTKLDAANQLPRPFWFEGFVEYTFGMGVQIVTDQDHFLTRRVAAFEQPRHFDGPIALCFCWTSRGLPLSGERFGEHEDVGRARPFVFVVDALGMIGGRLDGLSGLFDQLHGLFVHAEHRTCRIVGFFVGFEHLLHVGREFGVALWRDYPVLDLSIRHAVCFSVRRTVS